MGRKNTFHVFFVGGLALYCAVPALAAWGQDTSTEEAPVVLFYFVTMVIFTMYGGGFATIPAYLADVFGTMHVGAIHGRILVRYMTKRSSVISLSTTLEPVRGVCIPR